MIGYSFITKAETTNDRKHAQMMKIVNKAWAQRQRDERLQKHFEDIPETRPGGGYRYKKRGARYLKRKQNKQGHKRPNVWEGHLRASIIRKAKITATQHKGVLKSRGTVKSRQQKWQAAEIAAISNAERKQERKRTVRHYAQLARMKKYKVRRRRKVG